MILTDNRIREYIQNKAILRNYKEDNIVSIGYDLVADSFTNEQDNKCDVYELEPGDSVFVASKEAIYLPDNIMAEVVLRNSRIRQGLSLTAPVYQPGHNTVVFFRVTNISKSKIRLKRSDEIATILFYELPCPPDEKYNGAFQSEFNYKGMGKYGSEYTAQIVELDNKIEKIQDLEKSLYGNVITIMTIFIGIFSLLNFNFNALSNAWAGRDLIAYNLTIMGGISVLVGLVRTLIPNKKDFKPSYWLIPAVLLISAFIITL